MPASMTNLIKDAVTAAEIRGHDMDRFHHNKNNGGRTAMASCKRCGMYVQVDRDPPPNGINMGGDALALNCETKGA